MIVLDRFLFFMPAAIIVYFLHTSARTCPAPYFPLHADK